MQMETKDAGTWYIPSAAPADTVGELAEILAKERASEEPLLGRLLGVQLGHTTPSPRHCTSCRELVTVCVDSLLPARVHIAQLVMFISCYPGGHQNQIIHMKIIVVVLWCNSWVRLRNLFFNHVHVHTCICLDSLAGGICGGDDCLAPVTVEEMEGGICDGLKSGGEWGGVERPRYSTADSGCKKERP